MPRHAAAGIELLADPTRRRIVALIAARVRHPADIADALELSRSAISRQLRQLTQAGLLRYTWSRIDGRGRVYDIDPPMRDPIIAWLAGVDLRSIRAPVRPGWSPPMRVRRLSRFAKEVAFDRDDVA